jgi:hypothetical protein
MGDKYVHLEKFLKTNICRRWYVKHKYNSSELSIMNLLLRFLQGYKYCKASTAKNILPSSVIETNSVIKLTIFNHGIL